MGHGPDTPGVVANRLDAESYARNFDSLCPALSPAEAAVEANRCLFCENAPCVTACPTAIDIPRFIGQIAEGDPVAAARTIYDANVLGGICARVCPVDELCQGACVRQDDTGPPVAIAQLQRYATDAAMAAPGLVFQRADDSGFRVAVVGAGPAGLACAHGLALLGHAVTVLEAKDKPGGLNEFGVAAYKVPPGFAAAEIAWLMSVGGITLRTGIGLNREVSLGEVQEDHDAVFLGLGLAGVNAMRTDDTPLAHVHDAIDFIAGVRQAPGYDTIPVGRRVVVIGGGRTALDAAIQARLLGAEEVTIVYRRTADEMGATEQERLHATSKGVRIVTGAVPQRLVGKTAVEAVEFARTSPERPANAAQPETFALPADQVLKAMGQSLEDAPGGLRLQGGRIAIDARGRTSLPGVWAGGDCATGAGDLTVRAVAQGRDAASDIHAVLTAQGREAAE